MNLCEYNLTPVSVYDVLDKAQEDVALPTLFEYTIPPLVRLTTEHLLDCMPPIPNTQAPLLSSFGMYGNLMACEQHRHCTHHRQQQQHRHSSHSHHTHTHAADKSQEALSLPSSSTHNNSLPKPLSESVRKILNKRIIKPAKRASHVNIARPNGCILTLTSVKFDKDTIRLLYSYDPKSKLTTRYVFAVDLGVVAGIRRSNTSKKFNHLEQSTERVLISIPSRSKAMLKKGPIFTMLTALGIERILQTTDIISCFELRRWIKESLLPVLTPS